MWTSIFVSISLPEFLVMQTYVPQEGVDSQ